MCSLPAGAKMTSRSGIAATWKTAPARVDLGFYFVDKPATQTPSSIEIAPAPRMPAGKNWRALARRDGDQGGDDDRRDVAAARTRRAVARVTAIRPDGSVEPMLWVNNYRAEWPAPYILKEPMSLPAGTRLVMTAYYDNTTDAAIAAKPSADDYCAATVSPGAATLEPVNGIVDSTLLRWNCSHMR